MKRNVQCPKCGSRDVVADAKAVDRAGFNVETDLTVATVRNPQAFLFKGELKTALSAWVCLDCGFVEFYADSPRNIET